MIRAMKDLETLGRTLQALRGNLGLSRQQMAAKLKMPTSAVIRHETGRKAPTVDELQRYLRVLRCTLEEFNSVQEFMASFRDRTEQWWVKADLTAPQDGLDELGADLAKLLRRYAAEMVKKVSGHP